MTDPTPTPAPAQVSVEEARRAFYRAWVDIQAACQQVPGVKAPNLMALLDGFEAAVRAESRAEVERLRAALAAAREAWKVLAGVSTERHPSEQGVYRQAYWDMQRALRDDAAALSPAPLPAPVGRNDHREEL